MTTGKHILLDLLASEGVDIIFGNPGTTELPLMDAMVVEKRIRYIVGLNEVIVMVMADGYAQASGRLAVCNLHAAPGLGNAMGMLYNAKKAGSPVLVTAGQQDTTIALTEPLLWDDLATMARPLCKWSYEVTRLEDLPRAVRRAAKVALTHPTGPVFLSVPGDLLTNSIDNLDLLAPTRVASGVRGDTAAINFAAEMIAHAQNPVIFAGDAVPRGDAYAELAELAELIGAPVYLEGMANTAAFPASHRLYGGSIPRMTPAYRAAWKDHDLVISVGADLLTQSQAAGVEALPLGMPLVHIDTDAWEIGKNFPAAAAILGEPKATLPDLSSAVASLMAPATDRAVAVAAKLAATKAALVAKAEAEAHLLPLRPLPVIHAIGQLLPDDAIVIEEALSSGMNFIRHLIPSNHPDSYFGMRGGGIGMGLPQAIGAALAKPGRPVVALSGDGSAMYSVQALWTAAHYRLPVIFVILNNRSYRILKQRTRAIGDHSAREDTFVAMDFTDPPIDFVMLAEAQGVAAVRVETLDGLREALTRGLSANAPLLIDVVMDSTV